MKRLALMIFGASLIFTIISCSTTKTTSKNSVPFPGMTVTRADYKLSKDVTAEVEVQEFRTFLGLIRGAKVIGQNKNERKSGTINGYQLDPASEIAVYRLLEANPNFDYLTNIRIQKEYTSKWMFLFTKFNTKVKVVAKGVTLNTEN